MEGDPTAVADPIPTGGGLYDGFDGYRTVTLDDLGEALGEAIVVPDANVLLNLYRYTGDARDDLLTVLESLGDQLWVPHQVVREFWRNRESVLRDPRDTDRTASEISDLREQAIQVVRRWANRVFLSEDAKAELVAKLENGFDAVSEGVDELADAQAKESARDTDKDEVLIALEKVLDGKVGPALAGAAYDKALVEGLRRVADGEPPGYKDKKKDDDDAAGDYLVWEQILVEAERRGCNVLFVTGDLKEDWWRKEGGEHRGPRIELADEFYERAGARLFMLRPPRLLTFAEAALNVTVKQESVEDADRIDRLLAVPAKKLPSGGWSPALIDALLARLEDEGASVQAAAIRLAARQDGFVGRDQVYELGGYPSDRSLRGFTRPINRITQVFRDEGRIPDDAVEPFWAVYNDDSPNIGMAAGFRIHDTLREDGVLAEMAAPG